MVLSEAYHRDMDAPQRKDETEEEFLTRVESYAGDCSGVFDELLLINHLFRGLLSTITAVEVATVLECNSI